MNKKSLIGGGVNRFFNQNQSQEISENPDNPIDKLIELDIDLIIANKYQPRTVFEDEALLELSNSIQENGILQPLTVILNKEGKYELISGERRLRASKIAGLEKVPCILKVNVVDEKRSILAIIENLQREDLNCIELGLSYKKAMKDFNLSQDELATKLGVPRPNITNMIRLLTLPEKVIKLLEKGQLSLGHGKILAGIKDEALCIELAEKTFSNGYTVSKLTSLLKKDDKSEELKVVSPKEPTVNKYQQQESTLSEKLNLNTSIQNGKVIIQFNNDEELNHLINFFK